MDAIAGLSLAANILQLVELSGKLLSKGREIQQAGSTIQNSELETVAADVVALSTKLRSWTRPAPIQSGPLAQQDQALEALTVKIETIASELLTVLNSLARKPGGNAYRSWLHAIRTAWSAQKVRDVQSRLQAIRDELQFRILVSIKEEIIQGLDASSYKILTDIINSNKALTTDIQTRTQRIYDQQQVDGGLAAKRHKEVLDAVSSQTRGALTVDEIYSRVRSKLYSHRQDDRFEDIADAHQKTFSWILQAQTVGRDRPSLLTWLQDTSGTYWISGKAGSGKSTLFKYLTQDDRLKRALHQWAGDEELVVATFYFWRAGAPVQRSQTGLLQSLLWQILRQQPRLCSMLFPEQYVYGAVWDEFPTFHQLRRAFGRFTSHVADPAVSTRFAFIVDGLDEFEPDVIDFTGLANMFLTASKSSNVKALISSRPLPAFETSFGNVPKMRLHELTHSDITAYVEAELRSRIPVTDPPSHDDNNDADSLVTEIVDAAAGVFLWVKLVVQSLVEGIENGDTTEDLRVRLNVLPRDLENLFDFMISEIPDLYKVQSSQIFQLVRTHQEVCNYLQLTATGLLHAFKDETSILNTPAGPTSTLEKTRAERDVDRRLKSRCVGLLELRPRVIEIIAKADSGVDKEIHQDVVYLHRTVADYLHSARVWSKILSWTTGSKFNAPRQLLQIAIMELKTSERFPGLKRHLDPIKRLHLWDIVEDTLKMAQVAEKLDSASNLDLLNEFDNLVSTHYRIVPGDKHPGQTGVAENSRWYTHYAIYLAEKRIHIVDNGEQLTHPRPRIHSFLALTVVHGLERYVADTLVRRGKIALDTTGIPLLHCTCFPLRRFDYVLLPRMLKVLLEGGASPNQQFAHRTVLRRALTDRENKNAPFEYIRSLGLLLNHGADPNVFIDDDFHSRQSALRFIKSRFSRFLEGYIDTTGYAPLGAYLESQHVQLPEPIQAETLLRALSPKHKADLRALRAEIFKLIELFESRGAKDQEWRKTGAGIYVKVGGIRARCSDFIARIHSQKSEPQETPALEKFWDVI